MDKLDSTLREYLAPKAELLGAIRLPNDAFKQNADTEVTTDIVMLRKLHPGETPSRAGVEGGAASSPITTGERIPINEYFVDRPRDDAGRDAVDGRMYRDNEPTLGTDGRVLGEHWRRRFRSFLLASIARSGSNWRNRPRSRPFPPRITSNPTPTVFTMAWSASARRTSCVR